MLALVCVLGTGCGESTPRNGLQQDRAAAIEGARKQAAIQGAADDQLKLFEDAEHAGEVTLDIRERALQNASRCWRGN